jgi:two-component system chemotaxis sensor kinase CheA
MPYEDDDLFAELILEASERLTDVEPDLLALERMGAQASPELVSRIFRAMHSISAGLVFFSLSPLVDLSDAMERVLIRMRSGELTTDAEVARALRAGAAKLSSLLEDLPASASTSIEEELQPLMAILDREGPSLRWASGESA